MIKKILGFLLLVVFLVAPIFGQVPKKFTINPFTGQLDYFTSDNTITKTTTDLSFSVGANGDYATIEAAVAVLPNFIDHTVTLTVKNGTVITADPNLSSLRGVGALVITAETYLPKAPIYSAPTADGAAATYLQDVSVFTVDDKYNDCWVFVVNGTGTDNGFVKITDTVASTGRIAVAAWPGTQPDGTSKYMIVGVLVGDPSESNGLTLNSIDVSLFFYGIGFTATTYCGVYADRVKNLTLYYCGFYALPYDGIYMDRSQLSYINYCGFVGNNSENDTYCAGIHVLNCQLAAIGYNYIQGNSQRGIYLEENSYAEINANVGTLNGTWGTYAIDGSVGRHSGTKCSGSSGNLSNGAGDGSIAY